MFRLCVIALFTVVGVTFGAFTPNVITKKPTSGDYASTSPLILTPFINGHKYAEAKDASKVSLLNITSYSGFLTVDSAYDNNLFFWYFPAQQLDPSETSTIIWLQGGPGASSLYGLFEENGPYMIVNDVLQKRPVTWNSRHNMLYFDNPVGTGYSYTTKMGYRTNQEDVANDLYEALNQLSTLFGEIKTRPLYISGESYGGKYVPSLASAVLNKGGFKLEGVMIANGWISPSTQASYSSYLYQNGLLGRSELAAFTKLEEKLHYSMSYGKDDALDLLGDLIINFGDTPKQSLFTNFTGLHQFYDIVNDFNADLTSWSLFVQTADMRDKMHVGNSVLNSGALTIHFLKEDILNSTQPALEELLTKGIKVLLFHGQFDIICAYPMMEDLVKSLDWPESKAFNESPRGKWYVNGKLAGYKKEYAYLSTVLVRLASHMATKDQPEWVLDLIEKFTATKS